MNKILKFVSFKILISRYNPIKKIQIFFVKKKHQFDPNSLEIKKRPKLLAYGGPNIICWEDQTITSYLSVNHLHPEGRRNSSTS